MIPGPRSRIADTLRTAAPPAFIALVIAILLRFPPTQYSFYPQCPSTSSFIFNVRVAEARAPSLPYCADTSLKRCNSTHSSQCCFLSLQLMESAATGDSCDTERFAGLSRRLLCSTLHSASPPFLRSFAIFPFTCSSQDVKRPQHQPGPQEYSA